MINPTKKLLITGGSGFVGRNIIAQLHQERPDIAIYNMSSSPVPLEYVNNITIDARHFDKSLVADDFDYIIHSLALSNQHYCKDLDAAIDVNVTFTKQLFDVACTQQHLQKIIHISSIILYSSDTTPPVREDAQLNINHTTYSFTKGLAESYASFYHETFKLPVLVFRLANIYGPYQQIAGSPFLVPSKIADALAGKPVELFNGSIYRDWIYSEDAARAIVSGLDSNMTGVANLATGTGTSAGDIGREIAEQLGVPYHSLDQPVSGPTNFYCDITRISSELGWSPRVSLTNGLTRTIEYARTSLHI